MTDWTDPLTASRAPNESGRAFSGARKERAQALISAPAVSPPQRRTVVGSGVTGRARSSSRRPSRSESWRGSCLSVTASRRPVRCRAKTPPASGSPGRRASRPRSDWRWRGTPASARRCWSESSRSTRRPGCECSIRAPPAPTVRIASGRRGSSPTCIRHAGFEVAPHTAPAGGREVELVLALQAGRAATEFTSALNGPSRCA